MLDRNQRAWVSKLAGERTAGPIKADGLHADHCPKPGDLVILRKTSRSGVRYTIGRLDRPPQLSCGSRDKALEIAWACAAKVGGDVWEQAARGLMNVAPTRCGRNWTEGR